MSSQERWDVAIRVLNGPMLALGEQVLRGPVVRIGANPGPGGLQLSGYRGVDARQCVITAYDGGSAAVAPVGSNQVRLAPHANVNWKEIDPINGPEFLSEGCALHLGPVGRGATVEFVQCRRLGVWKRGNLASEADIVAGGGIGGPVAQQSGHGRGPVPASFDARKVSSVRTSTVPVWFLGCLTTMMGSTAVLLVGVVIAVFWGTRDVEKLGVVEEGYEFFQSVSIEEPPNPKLLDGLDQPMWDFVMRHNADASVGVLKNLDKPENWDQRFREMVTKSVEAHIRGKAFFRRMDAIQVEYGKVVRALRQANLPDVFAAIPYQESRYKPQLQSVVCAKGYWQFMPEVAHRVDTRHGISIPVRDCRFEGTSQLWSPKAFTPPPNVAKNGDYMDGGKCVITDCLVDGRTDLDKSTRAAIFMLKEAYDDAVLRRSGSLVQIVIASHNAGYDDSRLGARKGTNLLPAYKRYIEAYGEDAGPRFYGQQIRCPSHEPPDASTPGGTRCGSEIPAETQHYVYNVVAQHILASCYFAANYGQEPTYSPWTGYLGTSGYCGRFKIPTQAEVRKF